MQKSLIKELLLEYIKICEEETIVKTRALTAKIKEIISFNDKNIINKFNNELIRYFDALN